MVMLEARAVIDGTSYRSWASYHTDDKGEVDLAVAAPLRGTYSGVDRMGLFWSLLPIVRHGFAPASLDPIHVHLTLYTSAGTTHVTITRRRIAAGVTRSPLRDAPIVATVFRPKGVAHAVVVVLGGSEGGMDEGRAAIIASHGFYALALAYFGMAGLPSELANIPLEYVDRALGWVHEQPGMSKLPIILEGDSKGAELALLAAAHNPSVKSVVAFAPSSSVFEGFSTKDGTRRASWTMSGMPLAFADNPIPPEVKARIRAQRAAKQPVSFRDQYTALATPADPHSTIAVENIAGPVLLVAGADDRLWPSEIFAERIVAARKAHHMPFADELLVFPNAGHAIDVPYMPTAELAAFDEGSFSVALGGTAPGYAHADAAMWPTVLAFLKRVSSSYAPAPGIPGFDRWVGVEAVKIDRDRLERSLPPKEDQGIVLR
jgi:dienelactone hydrolase